MARHVWLIKKPTNGSDNPQRMLDGFLRCLEHREAFRLSLDDCARFACYALEMRRQKGYVSARSVLDGAVRSRFRFLEGRNRDNYLAGWTNHLPYIREVFGPWFWEWYGDPAPLADDAPWPIVADWMEDHGWSEAAAVVRFIMTD